MTSLSGNPNLRCPNRRARHNRRVDMVGQDLGDRIAERQAIFGEEGSDHTTIMTDLPNRVKRFC